MLRLPASLVLLVLLIATHARGALVSSNLFNLATINFATNTGVAVKLGSVTLPATTFAMQANGTGGTNFGGSGQILFGTTTNLLNMIPVGSYNFTNDTINSLILSNNGVIPAYFAFQAINTGNTNLQLGAQAIQNH